MSQTDEQEQRRCFVCGKPRLAIEQRQTCTPCLGRARQALIEIEQLYALLPDAIMVGSGGSLAGGQARNAETPVVGGDALVMLGPGSDGRMAAMASLYGLDDSHAADDLDSDPPAVLAALASWEDDWFEVRRERRLEQDGYQVDEDAPARPATIMQTVTWLARRLTEEAQRHDAFDEFAGDVRRLLGRLRSVTHSGDRYDYGAIDCPKCGGELFRDVFDPKRCKHAGPHCDHSDAVPERWACKGKACRCDQGGRRDRWTCRNRDCGRTMGSAEYWLLVRHKHAMEQQRKREEAEGADGS